MRPTEASLEKANEMAWVLLAVERFGSIGSKVQAGEALVRAGFIQKTGNETYNLTPSGEAMAKRIHRARFISSGDRT